MVFLVYHSVILIQYVFTPVLSTLIYSTAISPYHYAFIYEYTGLPQQTFALYLACSVADLAAYGSSRIYDPIDLGATQSALGLWLST